ncbi:hypothetical protein [uncultured Flavobacterium sp.]|uniref:hypothetical protein n=1 Tax=uncultured Flavobacterium sp. TaxID=165435 RepID=UPI0025913B78|nr:hypothetical protein [uncultured Flavobacterium sp.]
MNKKDRIAVVVSIFMLFVAAIKHNDASLVITMLLFIYWSYRFIKNDISFIKIKDE